MLQMKANHVHPLSTPVILLVTKITADLVQDG